MAKASDPGPSPGPQFVKVKWLKPVGDEPIGSIEWSETRRADGLVRDGYVELVKEDNPSETRKVMGGA